MKKRKIGLAFLFILFGAHLSLPLTIGGSVLIPEILISTFLLISGYVFRVLHSANIIVPLMGVIFISLIGILFSPDWSGHLLAHMRSTANLSFSLVVAFAFLLFLVRHEKKIDIVFSLKIFIFIMALSSVLEIAVPYYASIVDAFRYVVFPVERIYNAEWRDIELFGFKRPTFFGNEPSYLGITFAALTVCLLLACKVLYARIFALFLFVLGMLIVRSPTAVAIGVILPFILLSGVRKGWGRTITLSMTAFLFVLISVIAFEVFGERIDQALSGEDNSTDIRLVKPLVATWLSVSQSPMVGMGVGGRDKLTDAMLDFADWSSHTDYVFSGKRISNFFSTGLFLVFTETGATAFLILYLIFIAFRSVLPLIRVSDFLISFVLISVTMGGWTHPRIWLFVGLLLFFFQYRRSGNLARVNNEEPQHIVMDRM